MYTTHRRDTYGRHVGPGSLPTGHPAWHALQVAATALILVALGLLYVQAASTPTMTHGMVLDRYSVGDDQVLIVDLGSRYGPDRVTARGGNWRGCSIGDTYRVISGTC